MIDLHEELGKRGYTSSEDSSGAMHYEMPLEEDGRRVRVNAWPDNAPSGCHYSVALVAKRGGITSEFNFWKKGGQIVEREVLDMAVACEACGVSRAPREGVSSLDEACGIVQSHVGQTDGGLAGVIFSEFDYETGRNYDGEHWQEKGPELVMQYLLQERFHMQEEEGLNFEEWKRKVYLDPDTPFAGPAQPLAPGA